MLRYIFAIGLLAMLGACSNGIQEFRYFSEAYKAQAESGEAALDRLAVSERKLWAVGFDAKKNDPANDSTIIPAFDPDDARYIVDVGDPPLTASIRGSMRSVLHFNQAMTGLATGEAGTVLAARMSAAAVAVAGAAGSLSTAAGLPQGVALAPTVQTAVGAVGPLFEQLAQIEDRAKFRTLLIESYPQVKQLIGELRAGTAEMFEVHKEAYKEPGSLFGVEGVPEEKLPELERERLLLAQWVVLLDKSVAAMDEAILAISDDSVTPASLIAVSQELSRLAESVTRLRNQN